MSIKSSTKELLQSISLTLLGVLIYSFAICAFILPNGLISGGFGGIGAIIYYIFPNIKVGYTVFVLNAVMLIVAYKMMGKTFVLLTALGVTFMSGVLLILQTVITEPIISDDLFMNAIIGGIISGIGLGMSFNAGGNTGGTDIIALIVSAHRNVSPGKITLVCNVIIVFSLFILNLFKPDISFHENIEIIIYGLVVMGVTAYTLDFFLNGNRQSYQFIIMSKRYAEIADAITKQIGRGVTLLDAQGWYNKDSSHVIMVLAARGDRNKILRIIKNIDPKAFLSVSKVQGVYGRNFEKIK